MLKSSKVIKTEQLQVRMKHGRNNKGKAGGEMQTFSSSATPEFSKKGLCSVQILGIIKDSTHFLYLPSTTNDFHKEKQTGRSPVLNIDTNRSH